MIEQIIRVVLDIAFPGNLGVKRDDNQPSPRPVIIGGNLGQVIGIQNQGMGWDEMERVLVLLLRLDGINRTNLLNHACVQPLPFFQL